MCNVGWLEYLRGNISPTLYERMSRFLIILDKMSFKEFATSSSLEIILSFSTFIILSTISLLSMKVPVLIS